MTSVHTSSHVTRAQPCESVWAVPPAVGKALEVSALVAHVSGSVAVDSGCLLLGERVHVPTDRHCGAALWSLHLWLLKRCRLDACWYAVFGEGLQGSLGSELGVVVEGEDGGFVRSGRIGLVLLLRLLLWSVLLLQLLWRHASLLRCDLLLLLWLLHLLLGHTSLLWSHLCLPERILSRSRRERLRVLLLRYVGLRHVALLWLLRRRLLRCKEVILLPIDRCRGLNHWLLLHERRLRRCLRLL